MWMFLNKVFFYREELLAPRPTLKLEDHPLSAVRDCLFNLFAATHVSRDQNAGRIQSVRTVNITFESLEEFRYLGTTLTNQNSIAEEIKIRLRSGNAC